jgi:hypothetical protein
MEKELSLTEKNRSAMKKELFLTEKNRVAMEIELCLTQKKHSAIEKELFCAKKELNLLKNNGLGRFARFLLSNCRWFKPAGKERK